MTEVESSVLRNSVRNVNIREYNSIGIWFLLITASCLSPALGLILSVSFFIRYPTKKMAISCSLGVAFAAAAISYGIEYKHAVDMTRWMEECQFYNGKGILSIFDSLNPDHDGLLLWNFVCWVIGNIGDLYLLQAVAAFFGYGLMTWLIMYKCAEERTDRIAFLSLLLFVYLSIPTQPIVGGVRSALGCILCSVAFRTRRSYGLSDSVPGFILICCACLLHSSMVLGLVLFLFQSLISAHPVKISVIFAAGLMIIIAGSSIILSSHLFDSFPLLTEILKKASFYTVGTEWDQEQASNSLSIVSHVLSMVLLVLLYLRIASTGQQNEAASITLSTTLCVIVMEVTLVNVGNRLKYIPLLVGSTFLLNNHGREVAVSKRWPLIIDMILYFISLLVWLISMSSFLPSFNYQEVLLGALFTPLMYI